MPSPALDALFETQGSTVVLLGGEILYSADDIPDALYRLNSGRLAVTEPLHGGGSRLTRVLRPGDIIGAGALITNTAYETTATALRDCELRRLERDEVILAGRQADVYAELARKALELMAARGTGPAHKAAMLGFVAVCDSVEMRTIAERLGKAMRRLGVRVAVLGSEGMNATAPQLSALEDAHDFVLFAAESGQGEFTQFLGRQIDRLILVGATDTPLPRTPFRFGALAIHRHQLLDLVILHPADTRAPRSTVRWRAAAPAARLFHARRENDADLMCLARVFSGRSIGLAFSGGGARAYAHVGVAKALEALHVPVDFLAGTSMGAVVAAGMAMGWDFQELERRIREAFVESSPLTDIAFPLLAMTGGRVVEQRLRHHFGGVDIRDLWRPFSCVSTDLTTGGMHLHRTGALDRALRATVSLPGVLPPVIEQGHVLVDGALARNLPVDVVKSQHEGLTIGIDVGRAAGFSPADLRLQPSPWRWLTSGAWRHGPPIVSVLIRSATMPTKLAMAAANSSADLIIMPNVDHIELRNWKAYPPAVEAGYRATMEQAEKLSPWAV